jgi:hypothetical protein
MRISISRQVGERLRGRLRDAAGAGSRTMPVNGGTVGPRRMAGRLGRGWGRAAVWSVLAKDGGFGPELLGPTIIAAGELIALPGIEGGGAALEVGFELDANGGAGVPRVRQSLIHAAECKGGPRTSAVRGGWVVRKFFRAPPNSPAISNNQITKKLRHRNLIIVLGSRYLSIIGDR